ncbi:MAG: RluA family pseudouridine synthase [Desulfobulbaceae bacterium]|nr:RluA family pseudouridine synthase [Desulfobulbaceae bacterium]
MDTDGSLTLLYLDRHCAVVEKPGGLLAVPGRGPDKQDCVVNRLKRLCPWCIDQPAAHRLDMDTSGLMVLGLSRKAHRNLSSQFATQQVVKIYLALLDGEVTVDTDGGEIRLAFRLDPQRRPHQVHDPLQGKLGITLWKRLSSREGKTLVRMQPQTGRTHQLRLHASHTLGLGCPIIGDRLYGKGMQREQLHLHAAYLHFLHPLGGWRMGFLSQPPFLEDKIPTKFALNDLLFSDHGIT